MARPYGGLYAASKHSLEAISEALHYEVQPLGVRVVLIKPGQYGTRPRLRYLAGQDAHTIAGAYRQLEFEDYERAMRQTLDWWD